jgi:hypothetical protein
MKPIRGGLTITGVIMRVLFTAGSVIVLLGVTLIVAPFFLLMPARPDRERAGGDVQ